MQVPRTEPKEFEKAWPWPESLDALVAAPQHHSVLLENEHVRVVHTHIRIGDFVPVHTHRWPGVVHMLSWSDFVRRDENGNVLFDSRLGPPSDKISAVQWIEPLPPHSVENVGDADISMYIVEIKGSPQK
jgi:hypothetical protein